MIESSNEKTGTKRHVSTDTREHIKDTLLLMLKPVIFGPSALPRFVGKRILREERFIYTTTPLMTCWRILLTIACNLSIP